MRPAWLEIDLDALTDNVRRVKRCLTPGTGFLGIAKANAYGHGLVPVVRAALRGGADFVGVAILDEAIQLRDAGIDVPLLILGPPLPDDADEIAAAGVSQVVSEGEAIEALSRAAVRAGREIGLHLKLDTGMSRVGVPAEEGMRLAERIDRLPGLQLEGVCTHFATSDGDALFLEQQRLRFDDALLRLESRGFRPIYRHAANSGAVQHSRATDYDLVRPGLLLYGCPPYPDRAPELRPALSWKSRITQIRWVEAGAGVGYGITVRLRRPSRLAVVPVGYADGWPRSISNRGRVLVNGEWAPVLGRVSMDQFIADVTGVPGAQIGAEVVLVGRQGDKRQTVEEVAEAAEIIPHELLVGLSLRLPRIYSGARVGGTRENDEVP